MFVLYFYVAHLLVEVNAYGLLQNTALSQVYHSHNIMNKYLASVSDVPYHVLIAYSNLCCSGSLLRSKVVVTAASCFIRWTNSRIVVKVGAEAVTGIGQVIEVLELKKHEYFNYHSNMDNDIALLILKEHVIFSENVQKILMVEPEIALRDETTLDVSGWGSAILGTSGQVCTTIIDRIVAYHQNLQPSKLSNSLLWTEMILMSRKECKEHYPDLMSRSNFCVKYAPERRLYDNGGPAVFRDLLVGILSFGGADTGEPFVAVLTNVSYFHRWISLNTKRFLKKYCVPNEYHSEYDVSQVHDVWL